MPVNGLENMALDGNFSGRFPYRAGYDKYRHEGPRTVPLTPFVGKFAAIRGSGI
jgi:hypothetical protein